MDDLTTASAADLAAAIRAKKVSSLEVVEAHLERIANVNPNINAVAQLAAESARAAARDADGALAAGAADLGPLHGVPFTVKDWIETKGVVCAAGFEERADFVPKRDATVVARMRQAGAIMLAKTAVQVESKVYGRVRNPYDPSRIPGASSSGEAALIAACGSPLGLASDSGGSIRVPAAYCGVAGLKPTSGRVPSTGHFPRIGELGDPRTQIGPIARCVGDLALVLPVIAGVDWRDPSVVPMPLRDVDDVDIAALRVAWYSGHQGVEPDAAVAQMVRDVAESLAAACRFVVEAAPPMIERSFDLTMLYWRRVRSASWREWLPGKESELTADEIERSLFEWERLRRAFISFLEGYDVIVSPATAGPAPEEPILDEYLYTLPYSLTGWPCVAVRAGTSPEGLPIAVQVVARPWREDVALAVARRIEQAFGGWQPPRI